MTVSLLWSAATDLLVGSRCPGCRDPGPRACDACLAELGRGEVAPRPRALSPPLPIWSAGAYGGVTRRLLTAFKERRTASLAGVLSGRLAAAVAGLLVARDVGDPVVLVPVPSNAVAVRERTYDAVAELASGASSALQDVGVRVEVAPVLSHVRRVDDQSGLGQDGRVRNLNGALAAAEVTGALVVVVDDIVTTGATLAEAARALRQSGCAVLGAATVASTVKRVPARR